MKNLINASFFSVVGVLAPIQTVILTVLVLVFFDLTAGFVAALKNKQSIKSKILRKTIYKVIVYQLAIVSSFLVEKYLLGDTLPVTKMVGGLIGFVELISIFENLNLVYGSNLFTVLIQKFTKSAGIDMKDIKQNSQDSSSEAGASNKIEPSSGKSEAKTIGKSSSIPGLSDVSERMEAFKRSKSVSDK